MKSLRDHGKSDVMLISDIMMKTLIILGFKETMMGEIAMA
jgi:hypothetical protein